MVLPWEGSEYSRLGYQSLPASLIATALKLFGIIALFAVRRRAVWMWVASLAALGLTTLAAIDLHQSDYWSVAIGVWIHGAGVVLALLASIVTTATPRRRSPGLTVLLAPPPRVEVPQCWGWARLFDRGLETLGYHFIDPMSGPSFRAVADLTDRPGDAAVAARAQSALYLGTAIKLDRQHVWLHPSDPSDPATRGQTLRALTDRELWRYQLPSVPSWVGHYLDAPASSSQSRTIQDVSISR